MTRNLTKLDELSGRVIADFFALATDHDEVPEDLNEKLSMLGMKLSQQLDDFPQDAGIVIGYLVGKECEAMTGDQARVMIYDWLIARVTEHWNIAIGEDPDADT